MRYLYIPLLALLALGSCKKEDITYNCKLYPSIVLAPEGYTYTQWDTIEIRAFDANGVQIRDSIVYYPNNLEDVVNIFPTLSYNPDVSITIPATGDVHWLKNVIISQATIVVREDKDVPPCFNDLSYDINGEVKTFSGESVITQPLKKP